MKPLRLLPLLHVALLLTCQAPTNWAIPPTRTVPHPQRPLKGMHVDMFGRVIDFTPSPTPVPPTPPPTPTVAAVARKTRVRLNVAVNYYDPSAASGISVLIYFSVDPAGARLSSFQFSVICASDGYGLPLSRAVDGAAGAAGFNVMAARCVMEDQ